MADTIFTKIINKEAAADIVYENEVLVAFRDIRPKAPTHILIVPRQPVPDLNAFVPDQAELLGQLLLAAAVIAKQQGIAESGYKVIANIGDDGGQIIKHFHLHLLGGGPINGPV